MEIWHRCLLNGLVLPFGSRCFQPFYWFDWPILILQLLAGFLPIVSVLFHLGLFSFPVDKEHRKQAQSNRK